MVPIPSALDAIAGLADPTRRSLYAHIVDAAAPVTRDEAAEAVGIKRSLAAYHLDRLAEDGLLDVDYQRPDGKAGPGAGRPSKRYRRAEHDIELSLPPRSYRTAAEILLRALLQAGVPASDLERSAHDFGRELGGIGVDPALDALGFEARSQGRETVLCNCPFAALRDMDLELTCHMNLALVEGIIEAAGRSDLRCSLEPDDDYCCVRVHSS